MNFLPEQMENTAGNFASRAKQKFAKPQTDFRDFSACDAKVRQATDGLLPTCRVFCAKKKGGSAKTVHRRRRHVPAKLRPTLFIVKFLLPGLAILFISSTFATSGAFYASVA